MTINLLTIKDDIANEQFKVARDLSIYCVKQKYQEQFKNTYGAYITEQEQIIHQKYDDALAQVIAERMQMETFLISWSKFVSVYLNAMPPTPDQEHIDMVVELIETYDKKHRPVSSQAVKDIEDIEIQMRREIMQELYLQSFTSSVMH